ncbi:hypothetical protein JCM8547_008111 [Rhodosporidiobolus lusitaniae]
MLLHSPALPPLRPLFSRPSSRFLTPTSSPSSPSHLLSLSSARAYSEAPSLPRATHSQRALLYVPGSSPPERLTKVLSNGLVGQTGRGQPDVLILDLEDSVREERKAEASKAVRKALDNAPADCRSRKYVRINSGQRGFDDLEAILASPNLQGLVLPKVHTVADLKAVDDFVSRFGPSGKDLSIVASIESPLGLLNMREIATTTGRLEALLFAAEDYCASSRLFRSPSRTELLLARQSVVSVARAFNLNAIDLVCVQYKGDQALEVLREESEEGRRFGFGGKQVIHPGQVEVVQRAFSPTEEEIDCARRILAEYEAAKSSGAGAYGLKGKGGEVLMMDAPMLLQAESLLEQARSVGIEV